MKKPIVAVALILLFAVLSATGATVPIDCYLEYLGSAQAQHIDTGYVFTKKPRVEARAMVTTDADRYVFGTSASEAMR